MIEVYQIRLNDLEMFQLQAEGWDSENAKLRAYGRKMFGKVEDVNMEHYTHVANVYTNDMEEAFRLMNLWEGSDNIVEKLGACSSMSVGDVLEMEDGKRFVCASFGFKEI
jgi:hypothetical protein